MLTILTNRYRHSIFKSKSYHVNLFITQVKCLEEDRTHVSLYVKPCSLYALSLLSKYTVMYLSIDNFKISFVLSDLFDLALTFPH